MRLEQMRYLLDLQQTHSISKTAKRFFISQQSLSNAIKKWEDELGIELLERSASGVMLTEQAELLLGLGAPFLKQYDSLLERFALAQKEQQDLPTSLPIVCASILAGLALPSVVALLKKNYPHLTVTIRESSYAEPFASVADGMCAAAFVSVNEEYFLKQLGTSSVRYKILRTDRVVGCVSAKSSLAKKDIIEMRDMDKRVYTSLDVVPLDNVIVRDEPLYSGKNIEFHRRVLREMDAVALMPNYVYRTLFDNKYFVAKLTEGSQQVIYHAVLYAEERPSALVQELVQSVDERM